MGDYLYFSLLNDFCQLMFNLTQAKGYAKLFLRYIHFFPILDLVRGQPKVNFTEAAVYLLKRRILLTAALFYY